MFQTHLAQYQEQINQHLRAKIVEFTQPDLNIKPLDEALYYVSAQGGKRLRPILTLSIGAALNLNHQALLDCAVAVEFIHAYSLVHDDLPAMDNDDLRRGQPTCHIKFDEATAILAGDALQGLAFQTLIESTHLTAPQKVMASQLLLNASGPRGMIAGQMLDMLGETKSFNLDELSQLHQLKTGALITVSLLFGGLTSDQFTSLKPVLSSLGATLGLAFQIQDDILDIEAPTHLLGKTQGRDQALGKTTFPALLGLAKTKTMRDQLIQQAFKAVDDLAHHDAIQGDLSFLRQTIEFIAERTH